jgi:hypothetical protein
MLNNRLEIIVEVPDIPPTNGGNIYGITRYYLDTYGPEQDPMELNLSINDINDISNRNTSSSKTITLPETPNNRKVFGFVSDLNTNTLLFSPNKRTKCYILVDSIEVFKGWLQLRNIKPNYRTGLNKLDVIIYSSQFDFFKAVGESYLTDLQGFKDTAFTHSVSTMTASWFQDQTTTDLYYPLIDYGFTYDINLKEVATGFTGSLVGTYSYINVDAGTQMLPAVYLKSIVDCIFTSASGSNYYYNGITESTTYQYDSYFFNSPFFRSLIIPYNNGLFTVKSNKIFDAVEIDNTLSLSSGLSKSINWTTINSLGYFVQVSYLYGPFDDLITYYTYNGPARFYTLSGVFKGTSNTTPGGQILGFYVDKYTKSTNSTDTLFSATVSCSPSGSFDKDFSSTASFYLAPDDYLYYQYYYTGGSSTLSLSNVEVDFSIYTNDYLNIDIPVQLGDSCLVKNILPKNVKQKDFLTTLFKMFNLYVDYDPNVPSILRIEPRDDYYYFNSPTASSSPFYLKMDKYGESYFNTNNLIIKDWSNKVDINEDVDIQILANTQYKTINLTYKEDKDYYNENYKGFINRVYGNKLIEVDNDFNQGQQNIEVLFGPTVLANIFETYNFPIANLTKQIDTISNVPSGRSNANIKVMQRYWDYISPTSSYVVLNEPLPLALQNDKFVLSSRSLTLDNIYVTQSYTYSYYPYAGNFNNPYFPGADLNFDQAFYYYYNIGGASSGLSFSNEIGLNNTIYNCFYQNQMNEILNDTSRIVTCKMYLSPKDIQQFRFSDMIYLRLGSSGQYYHVNKISNYSLSDPNKTVDVELIKVLEVANYPIN